MAPIETLASPPHVARRRAFYAIAACAAALLGVFGLDALLFRTNLYTPILEPASSTGQFEMILRREQRFQAQSGDNLVVTLGDSRFGYLPRQANDLTSRSGYVFRHAGVAGSDPRSWYYMLRDLDPTAQRYRAVVLGVNGYDDEDLYIDDANNITSLHYVIARLRLSDILEFTRSFSWPELRWQVFRGSLLKGFVYQRDFQAFVSHPLKRIEYVKLCDRGYADWTYNYIEDPRSLAGLTIDWAKWTANFPPGADEVQRETVKSWLLRPVAPQIGRLGAFRRAWLGRIIDRYRHSRTKVIFVRLPRGAVPRPDGLVRPVSSSIREFASRPNVILSAEHAFDSLERPELFKDALHLNREGCARFAPLLVKEIAAILGPAGRAR